MVRPLVLRFCPEHLAHRYAAHTRVTHAPKPAHTSIFRTLLHRYVFHIRSHLKLTGLGLVRLAPFDVELTPKDVFQPDVFVVLNAHLGRVLRKKVVGAPDLVVEVSSPGTAAFDRLTKYDTYARAGVPEYWIINTDRRTVEVLALEDGKYHSLGIFRGRQMIPSRILPELSVQVEQFFLP